MPVLESTDHITPRSALRHRPILEDAEKEGKRTTATSGITPVAQRASRARQKQTEEQEKGDDQEQKNVNDNEDIEEWTRTGVDSSQTKRARATSAQPAATTAAKKLPRTPLLGGKRIVLRAHPMLLLGLGMVSMLVLWTLLTLAASWWNTTWDDIHYGRPRTFQIDAVVGHNDSSANPSHFIAINLNGHIEVIEFPGGDASKARIYIGPQLYGNGEDLIPVTLSFADVNGNHQPDMIIHFQDTRIVYINANGGFRPATPGELQTVEQYLQKHGQ